MTFVKDELKEIQKVLSPEGQEEVKEVSGNRNEKHKSSIRKAFLKITVNFLRMMDLDDLADLLQNSKNVIFLQKI